MALRRRLTFFAWENLSLEHPFDRLGAADTLLALDPIGRPIPFGAFDVDVLLRDRGDDKAPSMFQVLRMRDFDERPYVYAPGEDLAPVILLPHQSISDIAHVVMWADGYAALDQGGHAPPLSALAAFLPKRCSQWVRFIALFDRTLVQRLTNLRSIRRVDIGVENSVKRQHHLNEKKDPLFGLLAAVRDVDHVAIEATLKVNARGKGARDRALPTELADDLLQRATEAEAAYDTFRITGKTKQGKRETIDLIRERLHVQVDLPRAPQGGHLPDADATFSAIISARTHLESTGALHEAARGTLGTPEE
jgi:hypothetical protein